MAATSDFVTKASQSIPWASSVGIDYLAGAGTKGGCVQGGVYTMAAGGLVNFVALGLKTMASGSYVVVASNTSGTVIPSIKRDATRQVSGFTVTGPSVGDTIEFVVYGPLAGVLST